MIQCNYSPVKFECIEVGYCNVMVLSQITCSFFSARVLQKIPTVTAGVGTRAEVEEIPQISSQSNLLVLCREEKQTTLRKKPLSRDQYQHKILPMTLCL